VLPVGYAIDIGTYYHAYSAFYCDYLLFGSKTNTACELAFLSLLGGLEQAAN